MAIVRCVTISVRLCFLKSNLNVEFYLFFAFTCLSISIIYGAFFHMGLFSFQILLNVKFRWLF